MVVHPLVGVKTSTVVTGLFLNTDMLLAFWFDAAKSGFPSPSKSPATTKLQVAPVLEWPDERLRHEREAEAHYLYFWFLQDK